MVEFVGRQAELKVLADRFAKVTSGGQCLLVRGRRRVGKSRLVDAHLVGAIDSGTGEKRLRRQARAST